MGKLVFVVCQCPSPNVCTFSAKELEKNGYVECVHPDFDFLRKDLCRICGSLVYLKTGYSRAGIYEYGKRMITKLLQEKFTDLGSPKI